MIEKLKPVFTRSAIFKGWIKPGQEKHSIARLTTH